MILATYFRCAVWMFPFPESPYLANMLLATSYNNTWHYLFSLSSHRLQALPDIILVLRQAIRQGVVRGLFPASQIEKQGPQDSVITQPPRDPVPSFQLSSVLWFEGAAISCCARPGGTFLSDSRELVTEVQQRWRREHTCQFGCAWGRGSQ